MCFDREVQDSIARKKLPLKCKSAKIMGKFVKCI